jgi:hypothetical protein
MAYFVRSSFILAMSSLGQWSLNQFGQPAQPSLSIFPITLKRLSNPTSGLQILQDAD